MTIGVPDTGSGAIWHAQLEDLLHELAGDDLGRPALGHDRAAAHRDEVMGVPAGVVEVVQDEHDRAAVTPVEVDEQVEHLDLMGEVEERRRLVEQHDLGALRERHRDPDALALATRQLVDRALREGERVGRLERVGDRLLVGRRPLPDPRLVRVAPARDEVGNGDPLGRDRCLGQDPEAHRELLRRQLVDAAPVELHRAADRLEQPREAAQQRRLAARVGADDRRDPGRWDRHRQVGDDLEALVGQAQVLRAQREAFAHPFIHPFRCGWSGPAATAGTARPRCP